MEIIFHNLSLIYIKVLQTINIFLLIHSQIYYFTSKLTNKLEIDVTK